MQLISRCRSFGVAALVFAASFTHARAQSTEVSAGTRGGLYVDSDHTTIITSATEATARFDQRWQVGARYLADVVSSASIDVVTQGSVTFDDLRHDFGGSAGYRDDDGTSILGSYSRSTENDWQSNNVALSGGVDLLERNLSLSLSLAFQDNTITRSDTFGFERKLQSYLGNAAASYTLSPRDLLYVALAVSYNDGFQASPYRYITVQQLGYAENLPDQRTRVALVGRYHRDLGKNTSLRTHLRLYTDTYGIASLTGGAELAYERDAFDVMAMARGYAQTSASFYRGSYGSQQRYMTLDKELSTFWDVFVGGAVGWTFSEVSPLSRVRLEARVMANYFHFIDFVRLRERYGLTVTLGISGDL